VIFCSLNEIALQIFTPLNSIFQGINYPVLVVEEVHHTAKGQYHLHNIKTCTPQPTFDVEFFVLDKHELTHIKFGIPFGLLTLLVFSDALGTLLCINY
jgi:hypothetical protein